MATTFTKLDCNNMSHLDGKFIEFKREDQDAIYLGKVYSTNICGVIKPGETQFTLVKRTMSGIAYRVLSDVESQRLEKQLKDRAVFLCGRTSGSKKMRSLFY